MVRWFLAHDLQLLREMAVKFPRTAADWQLVADKLHTPEFPINSRGVRERWQKTILAKFKAENTDALKRSGE